MATHKSAAKAARQAERHRQVNRRNLTRLRTQVKKFRQAVETGGREAAETLLKPTLSLLDRSVHLGVIHRNAADRTKSRLTRHVQRLSPRS